MRIFLPRPDCMLCLIGISIMWSAPVGGRTRPMKLSLVVSTAGKNDGRVIPITSPSFLIGRDPACHLRPASVTIGKRHCALSIRQDRVYVRDLASVNGTFVNDRPVHVTRELHDGDLLKVGPLVFKVCLELTSSIDQPTPLPASLARDKEIADSVAAMLLALDAEEDDLEKNRDLAADSTIMEARAVSTSTITPPESKPALAPTDRQHAQDTSSAAKALLKKFRHRK